MNAEPLFFPAGSVSGTLAIRPQRSACRRVAVRLTLSGGFCTAVALTSMAMGPSPLGVISLVIPAFWCAVVLYAFVNLNTVRADDSRLDLPRWLLLRRLVAVGDVEALSDVSARRRATKLLVVGATGRTLGAVYTHTWPSGAVDMLRRRVLKDLDVDVERQVQSEAAPQVAETGVDAP